MSMVKKRIENYYPITISILSIFMYYFFLSSNKPAHSIIIRIIDDNLISVIITIYSALFGFLLTILALIYQMNNKMLDLVKEFDRFKDLIKYSKLSVYSSIAVVVFGIIIYITSKSELYIDIIRGIRYTYGFLIIYSFLTTMRFVNIFFLIAKSN